MPETAAARAPAGLLPSLAPLLRSWLPDQRWFAGKGRPVTGFSLVSATELLPVRGPGPGLLHLLVDVDHRPRPAAADPTPGRHPGADPDHDCYQLFLGIRRTLPPALAPALVGRPTRGPLAGLTVYEGLRDPRLAEIVLERLRTPGSLGPLRFAHPGPPPGPPGRDAFPVPPGGPTTRPLDADQSNSSLVYGDTYILKCFRHVQPGPNPDLELPLALARAGCSRVPAPLAWYESTAPRRYTLGVLQPYLRGSRDGWRLALEALAAGAPFTDEARALGRVTAEVHTALAGELPTVRLHGARTARLTAGMNRRLDQAARQVPALLPYAPRLRAAFDTIAELGRRGRSWQSQRVHGDLHLGQALYGPGDTGPGPPSGPHRPEDRDGRWSVIDFEGEPARPLGERRRPQPPVRDIAGMLRSFDYAARTHRPWRPEWAERCRDAYCEGYAEASGADPRAEPELLRAYETDKAVYEVVYEARHRPDWLPVPMAAIERLAAAPV
ncbi:maltokinase [Streptomyces sp. NPDC000594]|uniref:maltokinase N-terminal cap-like domain-containing protein n=1 Tax=Streptomyces sp. NPDC000594 TaxID=3154261 RepID=UPI003325E31B